MKTDNLFEQMANISKAHAYDIVSKQAQELKEENDRLKRVNKELLEMVKTLENEFAIFSNVPNDYKKLQGWPGDENPRTIAILKANELIAKYSAPVDLAKSFEKLKEDMKDVENDNDDLKQVNI